MIFLLTLLLTASAEQITTPPNNVVVFTGDPVKLTCAVEFSGTNTITWEFNDAPVYYFQFGEEEYPNDGKTIEGFSVKQDGTNFNLEITKATYSAAGKYACRLTTEEEVAYLIVLGKPHLIPSVPKPEEGNIAVFTCEARFGGPMKSDVPADIYPQLRISLDGKLIDGTTHLQEPKNSTEYHVLKLVYHTILDSIMHKKMLTCEILTANPKIVASTHERIMVQAASGTTPSVGAADSSGSMETAVAFGVINFLLIVGIILTVGFVAYKFVLKDNPRFQKTMAQYRPVKSTDSPDKNGESKHLPPGTSNKGKAGEPHDTKKDTAQSADAEEKMIPVAGQSESLQTTNQIEMELVGPNMPLLKQEKSSAQQPSYHQDTSQHGQQQPTIQEQPSYQQPSPSSQMQTSQGPHQGQGINQQSDPAMPKKNHADQDIPIPPTESIPQPSEDQGGFVGLKQGTQHEDPNKQGQSTSAAKEVESKAQRAAREAKEKAEALRGTANDLEKTLKEANVEVEKAAKKVQETKGKENKAAKKEENRIKSVRDAAKKKFVQADKKAKQAKDDAEQKAKKAEEEDKKKNQKLEKEAAKKGKGNVTRM